MDWADEIAKEISDWREYDVDNSQMFTDEELEAKISKALRDARQRAKNDIVLAFVGEITRIAKEVA